MLDTDAGDNAAIELACDDTLAGESAAIELPWDETLAGASAAKDDASDSAVETITLLLATFVFPLASRPDQPDLSS